MLCMFDGKMGRQRHGGGKAKSERKGTNIGMRALACSSDGNSGQKQGGNKSDLHCIGVGMT
jgi:hypothetical protein